MNIKTKLGFTLIEILVVVLIIGILGAIALPQYQRALLKSRYAALMPIAKSMANSNEAYYLEHGIYADDPQDLLIQGQSRYTDDTELEFGTVSDYAYVLAKNEDKIPNNTFIVYQKHSGEFPGEIHCEALADNDLAESVCKSFGGNESIGKTLTDGYETYVLFGTGNGVAPSGDNSGNDNPGDNPDTTEPEPEEPRPTVKNVTCGSVACTYYYNEGGYTTEWPTQKYTLSCDPDNGGCSDVYQGATGGGGNIYDAYRGYVLDYNADGSMNFMRIGERTDNGVYTSYFDASGNYTGGRVGPSSNLPNAGGIPNAQSAYYDSLGNVRRVEFNGTFYAYGADGKALSEDAPVQNVSSYNFLNTQDYAAQQAKANKLVGKGKCQLYPEFQECATNISN